jgi:hypothetical protein
VAEGLGLGAGAGGASLYPFAEAPWLGISPGLAILLAVASINFLGEGLREALAIRLRWPAASHLRAGEPEGLPSGKIARGRGPCSNRWN